MKRSTLSPAIFVALLVSLIGCDSKEKPAPAETTATASNTSGSATTDDAPAKTGPPTYRVGLEPDEDRDAALAKGEKLAAFLTEQTGIRIGAYVPKASGELVEAMQKKDAHIGYMSSWSFVAAHLNADASLLLAEERDGATTYQSSYFVAKDSGLETTKSLEGKKLAFATPTSTGGYLFPMMKLIEDGAVSRDDDLGKFAGEVVFAGGYKNALEALLAGKADAAATADYAPALYLSAEQQAKITPVGTHGPIPTNVIAVRADVKMDDQKKIKAAFLALNAPENQELLRSIYGAEKLVERSHGDHVYKLQEKLQELEVEYPVED